MRRVLSDTALSSVPTLFFLFLLRLPSICLPEVFLDSSFGTSIAELLYVRQKFMAYFEVDARFFAGFASLDLFGRGFRKLKNSTCFTACHVCTSKYMRMLESIGFLPLS